MRRFLRYANLIALGAGAVGMLLMSWIYLGGVDEKQLYPANHPAWILLWVISLPILAVFWLLSRKTGKSASFRANFPASVLGAAGRLAAGTGMLASGIGMFSDGSALAIVTGILGIGGGVLLYWGAWCRYLGRKSMIPIHLLPCFFFAARLFLLGQTLGAEPEMYRYLFSFLAGLAMLPACYWLWSFDVNLGQRRTCLFWCLTAAYCNLVAIIGSDQWFLHLTVAFWLLTNLPVLRYLPKRPRQTPAETVAPEPEPPQNADAILEELLKEFGADSNP